LLSAEFQASLDALWSELQTLASVHASTEEILAMTRVDTGLDCCELLQERLLAQCRCLSGGVRESRSRSVSASLTLRPHDVQAMGRELLADGRFRQAEVLFSRAVARFPRRFQFRVSLADILVRQHKFAEADAILRDGLRMAPQHKPFLLRLAAVNVSRHRVGAARERYRQVLRIEPMALKPLTALAELALMEGDLAETECLLRDGLALHPSAPRLLAIKARLLASQGEFEACSTLVAALVRETASDGALTAPLLALLLDVKFDGEVSEWLGRARASRPDDIATGDQWRRWLYEQGRSAAAIADELKSVKRIFAVRDQGPRLLDLAEGISDPVNRRDLLRRFCHHIEILLRT
jgi:Flp pilus assembly protein TadD